MMRERETDLMIMIGDCVQFVSLWVVDDVDVGLGGLIGRGGRAPRTPFYFPPFLEPELKTSENCPFARLINSN